MPFDSQLVAHLDRGLILDITLEDLPFRVYIAQREADVEQVAELVPEERLQGSGDVHVAAIHDQDDALEQIQDVLFNLNPGDSIVFLCTGPHAYAQALAELGQPLPDGTESGGHA